MSLKSARVRSRLSGQVGGRGRGASVRPVVVEGRWRLWGLVLWGVIVVLGTGAVVFGQGPGLPGGVGESLGGQLAVVRTPAMNVSYEVGSVKAGDIESVQLWYASGFEGGWQLYDYDYDRVSPIRFIAPGEGVYRFVVVAVDRWGGRSVGGGSSLSDSGGPGFGTPAQLTVFVDYTKPHLYLRSPRRAMPDYGERSLAIKWTGFDSHLGEGPVQLYYEALGGEEWHLIAHSQGASGEYLWRLPADLDGPVTIKVVIADRAGNRAVRSSGVITVLPAGEGASVPDVGDVSGVDLEDGTVEIDEAGVKALTVAAVSQSAMAGEGDVLVEGLRESDEAEGVRESSAGEGVVGVAELGERLGEVDVAERVRQSFREGLLYRERHEWAKSAEAFEEVVRLEPGCVEGRLNLANALYGMEEYEEAGVELARCLAEDGGLNKARWTLAYTQMALNQYAHAQNTLEELLEVDPADWQGWLLLGDVAEELGRTAVSLRSWRRVAESSSAPAELVEAANRNLGRYGP